MFALLAAGASWLSPGRERDHVPAVLKNAVEALDAAGAQSLAAAGRWWLGSIVGGDQGGELRARAEGWLVGQGVQEPARFVSTMLPGFGS